MGLYISIFASDGAKASTGARRCWRSIDEDDDESRGVVLLAVEAAQTAAEGAPAGSLAPAP